MKLHAQLRSIVEPTIPEETLYREAVVYQTTAKLALAVAEALELIDSESPPPSTTRLWDSALGRCPPLRAGVNARDLEYKVRAHFLRKLPKRLLRAFLVAGCPDRA